MHGHAYAHFSIGHAVQQGCIFIAIGLRIIHAPRRSMFTARADRCRIEMRALKLTAAMKQSWT